MNDKAKLIADKMAEPAVAKLKDAWTDPAAPRWLQVTKVKPTGVDHWVVRLRSGKEILLTDEEWNGAIYNADHAQGTPASRWREKGEIDPHGTRYDCERAST